MTGARGTVSLTTQGQGPSQRPSRISPFDRDHPERPRSGLGRVNQNIEDIEDSLVGPGHTPSPGMGNRLKLNVLLLLLLLLLLRAYSMSLMWHDMYVHRCLCMGPKV